MLKTLITDLISVLVTLSLYSCIKTGNQEAPLRIMPLGNSITQANANHAAYRYPLWNFLNKAGYSFDFVGSMKTNFMGNNPVQSFDQDHEGHWGWRADQIINGIPGHGSLKEFIRLHHPDVILIHLGSNDIFQGERIEEAASDLKEIISILAASNPDMIILMAQILPVSDEEINRRIRLLNDAIARLPSELSIPGLHLLVVDQYDGFDPLTDTYDGVHPNAEGENKMALKWYKAIEQATMK